MKLQDLKEINDNKLNNYIEKNEKKYDSSIEREIEIHKRIKNLLKKYDALFFQISMEDSLKILSKLVPEDKIKEVYAELISVENFKIIKEKNNK